MTAGRLLVGASLLLVAGCSGERPAPAPTTERPTPVTGVRVETVAPATVRDTVDAVGTVRTKTQVLIASSVQGYVREVRARQGDYVEAGGSWLPSTSESQPPVSPGRGPRSPKPAWASTR